MFDLNKRIHPQYSNKNKVLTSDLDIEISTETLTAWYSSVTYKIHVSWEASPKGQLKSKWLYNINYEPKIQSWKGHV